ncbi:NAD(P)/FAD-dependent oxidoreductase [Jatrophihabitans telluris]|uniref:NAD(P)/FAD-dependent oxidoreductase n=1 Tax=Jatrophihabitans telluris TaxID=2038343 RepID=A0ABY4QSU7_9ACTN|nr:NAD(P)/FAD-dependent oxidoreductase [Jatrophihabitans telluris]UQX86839.1 NAD(P)/FAD-dependent oxidoreductase [Jatrophihabitans telluris]
MAAEQAAVDPARSEWDVIVVGGAAAGENAAQYATQFSGLDAVIVEKELVGGECSYWACMPSKALLRPVELLSQARDLPGTKEIVGRHELDVAAVLARRDAVVKNLDDSSQVDWALGVGIDIVRGTARLAGVKTIVVTAPDGSERTLTARQAIVLDTGSSAAVPPVTGLAEAMPWTSRDVTNIHEIPRRVVLIGGGVVACESATWLRGLGVEHVTLVEGGPRLLGKLEPFAGEIVRQGFVDAGVAVHLGVHVESVSRDDVRDTGYGHVHGGEVSVTLADGTVIQADEVVVAAGRSPNSSGLGLESVGLSEGGYVEVDDHLGVVGVDGDWLYAIGDLTGRALLTHMGKYQARIAGEVISARAAGTPFDSGRFGRHTDVADHRKVPQVTFTDPEIGSVGLTEAEAREAGLDVETAEYDLAALAGTYVLRDNYVGRAKIVVDRSKDTLVGATFVGTGVAELNHSATMAVVGELPISALWHVVPSYPTVSEIWLRLLETLNNQRHQR